MQLYNEAILVTAVGSLPIRVGRQFAQYRKLGKTHQNVLVFYGGDPKRIPEQFGTVAVHDPFEQGAILDVSGSGSEPIDDSAPESESPDAQ